MQAEMSQLYYAKSPLYSAMSRILVELQNHSASWASREPVNPEAVPDYYTVIKNPKGTSVSTKSFPSYSFLVLRNGDGRINIKLA